VLVVDSLEETREVLRAALEPRGVRFLAAEEAGQGLAMARRHHPDLIVLDIESADDAGFGPDEFARQSQSAALVILGSALRDAAGVRCEHIVDKPYHYAPLIRKIESLLADRAGKADSAAR
jgi:CheY-like chemotaxis protein